MKELSYSNSEQRHEVQAGQNAKTEATAWLKAKAKASLLGEGGDEDLALAQQALSEVAGSKAKPLKAIKDIEPESDNEEAEQPTNNTRATDPDAEEADLLSDIGGSKNKDRANKRVKKMQVLVEKVYKECDPSSTNGKKLQGCLAGLKKLAKEGSKVKLESAKDKLFEAALAIKRVKKK